MKPARSDENAGVSEEPVLEVSGLSVEYRTSHGTVRAVSDVSFRIGRSETVALVGESGCGKSSTGRAVMMSPPPTGGVVRFGGTELGALRPRAVRQIRPGLQMIFQDPRSSLNPYRRVRALVAEGARLWRDDVDDAAVDATLREVGLDPAVVGGRRVGELSGGQCQRVAIARAILLRPRLIVCDEPVSALDVSVQAQILNLLHDLKDRHQLSLLFISHDLGVVKNISDRVAVMYLGRICEEGPVEEVYARPAHPYTRALLGSVPRIDAAVSAHGMHGEPPSPLSVPEGCPFRTRCPRAESRCAEARPHLKPIGPSHRVACHFPHTD